MKLVEFEYGIGDEAIIKIIEQRSRVISVMMDSQGAQYLVCYWMNGERKTTWVFGWELQYCKTA